MSRFTDAEGVALYVRIRQTLRDQIAAGELKPGDRLPSEDELALRFGVSRMTLRNSVSELIDEGLLYRRRGVGTFVSRPHIERDHNRLSTFFDSASAEGFAAEIRVLKQEIAESRPVVARELGLTVGDPVIFIRTLRLADGAPITLHDEFVPHRLCPQLLHEDLQLTMSWQALERHGHSIKRAVQRIEAVPVEREIAALLEMEEGEPVLYKRRTVFAADGTPVEFAFCYNRGDRYSVNMTLTR